MTAEPAESFRLICSGARQPHVVRTLVVLRRIGGRPDLYLAAQRSGLDELAQTYLAPAERLWGVATSSQQVNADGTRKSNRMAPARIVPGKAGGQVLHVPACPDCGRGKGLRLSVEKLLTAAVAFPNGVDVALFYA